MSIFIERAELHKHNYIGYIQVTIFLEALSLQILKKNPYKPHTHTTSTTAQSA